MNTPAKPAILVARRIFPETLARLHEQPKAGCDRVARIERDKDVGDLDALPPQILDHRMGDIARKISTKATVLHHQ